jgi:hypothetical protein
LPTGWSCPVRSEPGWQRVYADRVAEIYQRGDHIGALRSGSVTTSAESAFFP